MSSGISIELLDVIPTGTMEAFILKQELSPPCLRHPLEHPLVLVLAPLEWE
jgi:hypothetical protein